MGEKTWYTYEYRWDKPLKQKHKPAESKPKIQTAEKYKKRHIHQNYDW